MFHHKAGLSTMYVHPTSYTFRLPTYLTYLPGSLSVLMIATQKWLCVPLRVRPSAHVSNFLKKKRAASEFPVYVLCWLPLFHIHQSYMLGCKRKKKKKKKNLSGLVSAWETTYTRI